jgi:hypothetical protein
VRSPVAFLARPISLSQKLIPSLLAGYPRYEYPQWAQKTPDPENLSALRI